MISVQFDNFISACENEVAERNSHEYGDEIVQDVVWNCFYPFLRKQGREECVLVSCDVIYTREGAVKKKIAGKNGKATMSQHELELTLKENKDMTLEECAKKLVDLATNKARGDIMI